jgi:hypothetical protein
VGWGLMAANVGLLAAIEVSAAAMALAALIAVCWPVGPGRRAADQRDHVHGQREATVPADVIPRPPG